MGQILGKRSLRSRKGLSTAVGTAFYIIVVMISLSSMWAIGAFQARYQAVTDKMNVWDTERISENLNVRILTMPESMDGGTWYKFKIRVDNNGGVAVNIARIYFKYLHTYPPPDTTRTVLNITDPVGWSVTPPPLGFLSTNSTINTGEGSHVIPVSVPVTGTPPVTPLLVTQLQNSQACSIILTTDRGRQFSYSYPPPDTGGGGVGPANIGYLVVTFQSSSLLYTDYTHLSTTPAWDDLNHGADTVVWHLNITNVGKRPITLLMASRLILASSTTGNMVVTGPWYISQPPTAVPPGWNRGNNPTGVPGYTDNQIIQSGTSQWVAFGSDVSGGASTYSTGHRIPGVGFATNDVAWVFLEFRYLYGTEYFSQVIPFAAITFN